MRINEKVIIPGGGDNIAKQVIEILVKRGDIDLTLFFA